MWLGVDYYPEQWNESMMDSDLDNIVELGSNVIRIAEFAWHLIEKKEGEFDFSFFDRVIQKAKEKKLKGYNGHANSNYSGMACLQASGYNLRI